MNSKIMDSNSNEPKNEGFDRQVSFIEIVWFVLAAAFVFLILAYWYSFSKYGWSTNPDAWGQFGDFLGGVLNPLVSLAALFALVISVRMQRTELKDTRAELIEARKVASEQAKTADQQRREQRFFDLLNLYQRTVDSLSWYDTKTSIIGKQAMSNWIYDFSRITNLHPIHIFIQRGFFENNRIGHPYHEINNLEMLTRSWNSSEISNYIDPYFRVIHQILAEAHDLLGADAQRYIKLLRAQFNSNEVTLLALNMWLNSDSETVLPYATEYGLLKYLPEGNLKTEVTKVFNASIFDSPEVTQ
jgi:Putative phage abortive infection protein